MRRPATTGFPILMIISMAACSHVVPRPSETAAAPIEVTHSATSTATAPPPPPETAHQVAVAQAEAQAAPATEVTPVEVSPTPEVAATPAPAGVRQPKAGAAELAKPKPAGGDAVAKSPATAASASAAPVAPASTAAVAARPASPAALDLAALEQRLRDTHAIGLFTKLSVKNQVDDLLGEFRIYHGGRVPPTLVDLRQHYELLLLKVRTLLQDGDPPLASAVAASRDAIWGILSDREKFQKI